MVDHSELVKALRYCSTTKGMVYCNVNCKYGWEERSGGCKDILMTDAAAAIEALQAEVPHWVSVEERKPPEHTDVWCAVYTTDIIYMEDGETPEEAIENRQREAARNPRMTMGSYSEDEGWTDGYFGMPMVCQPDYWLEMTIPEPPQEMQE